MKKKIVSLCVTFFSSWSWAKRHCNFAYERSNNYDANFPFSFHFIFKCCFVSCVAFPPTTLCDVGETGDYVQRCVPLMLRFLLYIGEAPCDLFCLSSTTDSPFSTFFCTSPFFLSLISNFKLSHRQFPVENGTDKGLMLLDLKKKTNNTLEVGNVFKK